MQKLGPKQLRWVEALESGEFKQGNGFLKRNLDGELLYCCLGVLNELEGFPSVCVSNGIFTFSLTNSASLDSTQMDRVMLYSNVGSFTESINGYSSLANMNDSGLSFKEIAKVIRENPEKVFSKEA